MKTNLMLCEKTTESELPYLQGDYLANIKYDGERVLSIIENGQVIMLNRTGKIVNSHFKEVEAELRKLPNCIIDGEVISYNNNFQRLQSRALTQNQTKQGILQKEIPCLYAIFDMIKFGEQDLKNKPLNVRLGFLDKLGLKKAVYLPYGERKEGEDTFNTPLFVCSYIPIQECLKIAKENKCEGIIIKDLNAVYENRRSRAWLKLKFFQEAEITLTKFTTNNAGIRAEDNKGNVVQISGEQAKPIAERLLKGEQVSVYIQYLTMGDTGRMRFPSFRGVKNGTIQE